MPSMPLVRDYMTPNPHSIQDHESLPRARSLMREHGIRHLLVFSDGMLAGLVSERDLGLLDELPAIVAEPLTVKDVMSTDPYTVPAHNALASVAREMARRRCGSAVVSEGGAFVGIFTTVDALEALADALEGKHARVGHEAITREPERGATRPISREPR
jgi:acetoin utilization protein AcuB